MKKIILRLIAGLCLALLILVVVLGVNLMLFSAPTYERAPAKPIDVTEDAAKRLSQGVQLKTISTPDPADTTFETFTQYVQLLQTSYPTTHKALKREVLGEANLIFTWTGSDPSLKPVLMLGHMDVVPIEPKTLSSWTQPPFSGAISGGFIWGRGTLDDKVNVQGILEATEGLLKQGFEPRRTIVFAFGQDEEVGGRRGAKLIAQRFKEQGLSFEFALDEGHVITKGIVPGVDKPVALIGLAEKGFVSVTMTVDGTGGHSSMPPTHSALGVLARAITRVEDNQMPARLIGPSRRMFEEIGPHMGFVNKLAMANLWLLEPMVINLLEAKPTTNATVRTTTAVTQAFGSAQDNILPQRAQAVINFRILPGDTIDAVLAHVRAVVDDDRVKVASLGGFNANPSPLSSDDTRAFTLLRQSIQSIWPDVHVAPSLTIAATDLRHYQEVAQDSYRFSPIILGPEDTVRLHGVNERIPVKDYLDAVRFYSLVLRGAASGQ